MANTYCEVCGFRWDTDRYDYCPTCVVRFESRIDVSRMTKSDRIRELKFLDKYRDIPNLPRNAKERRIFELCGSDSDGMDLEERIEKILKEVPKTHSYGHQVTDTRRAATPAPAPTLQYIPPPTSVPTRIPAIGPQGTRTGWAGQGQKKTRWATKGSSHTGTSKTTFTFDPADDPDDDDMALDDPNLDLDDVDDYLTNP